MLLRHADCHIMMMICHFRRYAAAFCCYAAMLSLFFRHAFAAITLPLFFTAA